MSSFQRETQLSQQVREAMADAAPVNFYWLTKDQITAVWFYVSSQTHYAQEAFYSACCTVCMYAQANIKSSVELARKADPNAYPYSAGKAMVPKDVYNKIEEVLRGKRLGEDLLENEDSVGKILNILPQKR